MTSGSSYEYPPPGPTFDKFHEVLGEILVKYKVSRPPEGHNGSAFDENPLINT